MVYRVGLTIGLVTGIPSIESLFKTNKLSSANCPTEEKITNTAFTSRTYRHLRLPIPRTCLRSHLLGENVAKEATELHQSDLDMAG